MNGWLLEAYDELMDWELDLLEKWLWNADLDFDVERAIEKLILFNKRFERGELEVKHIIDLIEEHTNDYEVEEIINAIKDWLPKERNEISVKEYSDKMIKWSGYTKDMLKQECVYYNLAQGGTKQDLIERLSEHIQSEYTIITV